MASKVGCSLKIYETKANDISPNLAAAAAVGGGIIQIRIKFRYQLCVKAHGLEFVVDDIITPEFVTPFAMPLAFLLPELSVMHVSNMLAGLNVDAEVREFSSPKIAKYAVDVAKRRGSAVSDFMTVAQVSINKVDYILEEEFNRIWRTLKQEHNVGGSEEKSLHVQNLKSEEN